MAERVVDQLEAVEVEEEARDALARPAGALARELDVVEEHARVGLGDRLAAPGDPGELLAGRQAVGAADGEAGVVGRRPAPPLSREPSGTGRIRH